VAVNNIHPSIKTPASNTGIQICPGSSGIRIDFRKALSAPATIRIYSLHGEQLYHSCVPAGASQRVCTIPLAAGSYCTRIRAGAEEQVRTFSIITR
jgi:hypothetical protein